MALAHYRKALALHPDSAIARVEFAEGLTKMYGKSRLDEATAHGIGHLTRVYGTRPVDPVERAAWLWREQRRLVTETRLGIPALVHEECLTGLAAWQAATYSTPLAWGGTFDPDLVAEMGALIGTSSMRTPTAS